MTVCGPGSQIYIAQAHQSQVVWNGFRRKNGNEPPVGKYACCSTCKANHTQGMYLSMSSRGNVGFPTFLCLRRLLKHVLVLSHRVAAPVEAQNDFSIDDDDRNHSTLRSPQTSKAGSV